MYTHFINVDLKYSIRDLWLNTNQIKFIEHVQDKTTKDWIYRVYMTDGTEFDLKVNDSNRNKLGL